MARDNWLVQGRRWSETSKGFVDPAPDEQALIDRLNHHVRCCQECKDWSDPPGCSWEWCSVASALVDARDTFLRTLEHTQESYLRFRYGAPGRRLAALAREIVRQAEKHADTSAALSELEKCLREEWPTPEGSVGD